MAYIRITTFTFTDGIVVNTHDEWKVVTTPYISSSLRAAMIEEHINNSNILSSSMSFNGDSAVFTKEWTSRIAAKNSYNGPISVQIKKAYASLVATPGITKTFTTSYS